MAVILTKNIFYAQVHKRAMGRTPSAGRGIVKSCHNAIPAQSYATRSGKIKNGSKRLDGKPVDTGHGKDVDDSTDPMRLLATETKKPFKNVLSFIVDKCKLFNGLPGVQYIAAPFNKVFIFNEERDEFIKDNPEFSSMCEKLRETTENKPVVTVYPKDYLEPTENKEFTKTKPEYEKIPKDDEIH